MRIRQKLRKIFLLLTVCNFTALNANSVVSAPNFYFGLRDGSSISETFLDIDKDGKVDSWYFSSDKNESISVDFDKLGRANIISIKKKLTKFNAIIEFGRSNSNFKITKMFFYKPQIYAFSEDIDLISSDDLKSSASGSVCAATAASTNFENIDSFVKGVRSNEFKSKISNNCDRKDGLSKQAITEAIVGSEELDLNNVHLLECMKEISKIVDVNEKGNKQNCKLMKGAYGNLKNLLNLDFYGKTKFTIDCQIDSSIDGEKCISGNFIESNQSGVGDSIIIKSSPNCSKLEPMKLKELVFHEMIHRSIPAAISGVYNNDTIEKTVQRMTSFCMSKTRSEQELCGQSKTTGLATIGEVKETQQKISQQEVPVELTKETPVEKVVIPNAFPTINRYLGPSSVVASTAPTGSVAVGAAQVRVAPILSFARSMFSSVERAQASGKYDPNTNYFYDATDNAPTKTEPAISRSRAPANEAAMPTKNQGVDNTDFNSSGSSKLDIQQGNSARSPVQIAEDKAKALVNSSTKLSTEQKQSAEKVLAYVLNAKSKAELKTFLIHKKRELDRLHIHVIDASANEIFGYDDSSTANMMFSISSEGKLIDETLSP